MTTNFSAHAIIGVRLRDVYEEKQIKRTITKYNEDTGIPYQEIVERVICYFCGKQVAEVGYSKQNEYTKSIIERHFDWLNRGLCLRLPYNSSDYDFLMEHGLIGAEVLSVNTNETTELLCNQNNNVEKIRQRLVVQGCDFIVPQIFIQVVIT